MWRETGDDGRPRCVLCNVGGPQAADDFADRAGAVEAALDAVVTGGGPTRGHGGAGGG